jgi:hypothetical protein
VPGERLPVWMREASSTAGVKQIFSAMCYYFTTLQLNVSLPAVRSRVGVPDDEVPVGIKSPISRSLGRFGVSMDQWAICHTCSSASAVVGSIVGSTPVSIIPRRH